MSKIKRLGAILLSICLLIGLFPSEAFAASGRVTVSSVSGKVGSGVSVKCTATISGADIGGADVTLTYDASALKLVSCSSGANGGSGSVLYSGMATAAGQTALSFTVNFEILKEGSHKIETTYASIFDWDFNDVDTGKGSGTVTGKAETTPPPTVDPTPDPNPNPNPNPNPDPKPDNKKDSNSKLKSLRISLGTLSPAFSENVERYTVTVGGDVKSITISAAAQKSTSKVTVYGGKDLQVGENEAKVVVMAEDGSTTVYYITITKGELEKIPVGDEIYHVNEGFGDEFIPEGFVKDKITYNEKEFTALRFERADLKVVSLYNDDNAAEFYIYDEASQSFYPFVQIEIGEGKYLIPVLLNESATFNGFEEIKLVFEEKEVPAWKLDQDFSVIRAYNQDGAEVFYRYDSVDGLIQRYTEPVEPPVIEEPPVEKEKTIIDGYELYIIIGLGVLVLVLLIALICVLASSKHKHAVANVKIRKRIQKRTEKAITDEFEK